MGALPSCMEEREEGGAHQEGSDGSPELPGALLHPAIPSGALFKVWGLGFRVARGFIVPP